MFSLPRTINFGLKFRFCADNKISRERFNYEGKTEDEIYEFMSDKYGDWIVFKPQFNTQNFLLWILPYIALIFGGFFIFSFLKKRQ